MEKSRILNILERLKELNFTIYTIFYNGNYYEVEVDNDEINTEVTHPDYEAVLINH